MKNNILTLCIALLVSLSYSCKKNQIQKIEPNEDLAVIDTTDLNMADVTFSQLSLPGSFKVIAGKLNSKAQTDGNGAQARFLSPSGIFVNPDGSLLLADNEGDVRKLTHDTVVTTIHFPTDVDGFNFAGGFDIAATKDGTIAVTDFQAYWLYTPDGVLRYHGVDNHNAIGMGIDKDPSGNFFWYTDFTQLLAVYPNGDHISTKPFTPASYFTGLSASHNGVKYITGSREIYKYTKSGISAQILTEFTYDNISSITTTRDGYKIYIADGGDIKMITNNPLYPKTITTILAGQHAIGVALSNSEKYLYFATGGEYNTVGKLKL